LSTGRNRKVLKLVGAACSYQIGSAQKGFKSAGVRPPAIEDSVGQRLLIKILVVNARNLKLSARRRFQTPDPLEDRIVIHVDPNHGVR